MSDDDHHSDDFENSLDAWGEVPDWARDNDQADGGIVDPETDNDRAFDFGAQHTLLLIDCGSAMFQPCVQYQPSGDHNNSRLGKDGLFKISPFDAALVASEQLLIMSVNEAAMAKGYTGKRDGVGIILYNTKRHNLDGSSSRRTATTYELMPLHPPGVQQILDLRKCLPWAQLCRDGSSSQQRRPRKRDLKSEFKDVDDDHLQPSEIAVRMGNATLSSLRSAIHEANKAFLNAECVKKNTPSSKQGNDLKTLWIFTNNDNPCHSSDDEMKKVIVVAKDASDNGIEIRLRPLPCCCDYRDNAVKKFDSSIFFDSLTSVKESDEKPEQDDHFNGEDIDNFLYSVKRDWKKVRRTLCIPLFLPGAEANDPGIMIELYRATQSQTRPTPLIVHQETNKVTMRVTQKLALDSGEIVREHQLRSFVEFGGERVVISSDEVSHIKKLSNGSKKSSLSILGFKPMNSIPKMHIMDRPYFAYPSDEEGILGSKEAFSALHTAMLDKKVLAIGKLITSVKATCHLVAIIPQCESTSYVGKESSPTLGSDEQEKSYSSGFLIVHIPYEDDIRSLEDNFHASADSRLVKAVEGIICNQQFDEINLGNCFPNPAMSNFWNYIESIALGTRRVKSEDCNIDMDSEGIMESAGKHIETFMSLLPIEEHKEKERKRKRDAASVSDASNHSEWLNMLRTGALDECTVDALKKYLRSSGLTISGRKAELLARVAESIEKNAQTNLENGEHVSSPKTSSVV